jgi:hypothetical protein
MKQNFFNSITYFEAEQNCRLNGGTTIPRFKRRSCMLNCKTFSTLEPALKDDEDETTPNFITATTANDQGWNVDDSENEGQSDGSSTNDNATVSTEDTETGEEKDNNAESSSTTGENGNNGDDDNEIQGSGETTAHSEDSENGDGQDNASSESSSTTGENGDNGDDDNEIQGSDETTAHSEDSENGDGQDNASSESSSTTGENGNNEDDGENTGETTVVVDDFAEYPDSKTNGTDSNCDSFLYDPVAVFAEIKLNIKFSEKVNKTLRLVLKSKAISNLLNRPQ